MRVAHVIKVKQIAGAEQHLLTLMAGLVERGVDVRLVILVEPSLPMHELVAAAAARNVPTQRVKIYHHTDFTTLWRLFKLLRAMRPDIVHTHLQHADLYAIPAAKAARVPLTITSRHNDDIRRRHWTLRRINKMLWWFVDAGISISNAIGDFSVEIEGANPAKIRTIYYGLHPPAEATGREQASSALRDELNLSSDARFIGMACRLIEVKGIAYALRAFQRNAERFPGAQMVIAGNGPLRASLEEEAATLGIRDRVHFLGWREDIPGFMAALDMLLMPSLREGFGLAMLDAMAQSVPIIASAVSAIPEVVTDHETGLLVAPRDVDGLAAAMSLLLEDLELSRYMGLLGQDRFETYFTAARMVEATLALYDELLQARKA